MGSDGEVTLSGHVACIALSMGQLVAALCVARSNPWTRSPCGFIGSVGTSESMVVPWERRCPRVRGRCDLATLESSGGGGVEDLRSWTASVGVGSADGAGAVEETALVSSRSVSLACWRR